MEAENWHHVKEILELAIERPAGEREHFIEERCSGDVALRNKVDSLISSFERVGDFMEDGPIGSVADMFTSDDGLQPGERLGRYEIIRVLGEGGMGKVYLADDPDLHRQVAIKVLRNDLWWYKQARRRLSREARAAARLDHPNICSIYEIEDSDERSFIVMQYVEGNTLSDVMAHGGLGGRESLRLALQIAGALEEAHSHHIIHRDIKPANIIINEKRQVKVLDFGLAKSIKPGSEENEMDLSSSGAVMGTVPYMSPEQLRGKTVDGRSDIFSFGALLYEMVSGRQAFRRESNAETISSILNDEPDLSVIPLSFRPVVERSLRKKAADRYQNIAEVAKDLRCLESGVIDETVPEFSFSNWFGARSVISTAFRRYFSDKSGRALYRWQDSDSDARTVRLTEPVPSIQVTDRHPLTFRSRPVLLIGVSILVVAMIPAFLYWFMRPPQSDPHSFDSLRPVRLVSWKDAASSVYLGFSSSHNGKMIAYSSKQDGPNGGIYVRQISEGGDIRVTKDDWNNYSPIWSPDDQRLAFVSFRNNVYGIYSTPFLGGGATLIKSIDRGTVFLQHWSNDSAAIYYEFNGNLFRLDLSTRQSEQITSFTPREASTREFAFSPTEDRIVYRDVENGQTDLWMRQVNGGEPVRLTSDREKESRPSWHPDGNRIIYSVVRDGYSQIKVAYVDGRQPEQITRGEGEHQLIDVSADGKNIFYTTWEDRSDVWCIDVETGRESQVADGKEAEFWPDVSPDGKSILYQTNPALNPIGFMTDSSIAVTLHRESGVPTVIKGYDPRWMPDGQHIAFYRWQGPEKQNALWTFDTVTGAEEKIIDEKAVSPGYAGLPFDRFQSREFSWSPDGRQVVYVSSSFGIWNVNRKTIGESEAASISQNAEQGVSFYCPLLSLDGKSVAYVSVRNPATDGGRPVSAVWINDGVNTKQLYSTTDGLRLLAWDGNESLVIASTEGNLKAGPSEIKIVKLPITGKAVAVMSLKNAYPFSISLSVDEKTVAFSARQNERDDIFIVPLKGGLARKLSANEDSRIYLGSLAWSPDGKSIYFDKQEKLNTISMLENFK